jgi:uncharacterized repeat protein (TIGR01451 family)
MKTKLLPLLLFTFSSTVFAADAPEFVKNGDGTVTHNPTGLILKTCAEGQVWDASFATCSGTAKTYSIDESKKLTSDFAGQKDWRLPTAEEMQAMMEGIKFGLTSNANFTKSFFPFTQSGAYLSSSSSANYYRSNYYTSDDKYYNVGNFADGVSSFPYYSYSSSPLVRLIRNTTWFGSLPTTTPATPTTDFVNNLDGTITHTKTGLTWQRCVVGQTWVDGYCDGTAKTFTHQNAVALTSDLGGKTDWRLPTFKELQSIVDYQNGVNKYVFPDAPVGTFWSATNYTGGDKTKAFYVSFKPYGYGFYDCCGYGFYDVKTKTYMARLVRGTPLSGSIVEYIPNATQTTTPVIPTSVNLVATVTASPTPATVNNDITFTGTVSNKGTLAATDTKLTFYIPKNTMVLSTKPADCEDKGLSVVCPIGNLVPNASVNRVVTAKSKIAGGLSFSVSASSTEKDANQKDNIGRTTLAIRK